MRGEGKPLDTARTRARRLLHGPWPGRIRDVVLAAALVLCGQGAMATTGPTGPISLFLPLLALAALVAGRASAQARFTALWLAGALLWCLTRAVLEAEPWSGMADAIILVMFGVLPWLIGRHLRQRNVLLNTGWQRAASLERELAAVAEQERLRERTRIAEEMHDSLGHELSLMAVRAGAVEVAPGLSEEDFRNAAGELREGATSAIDRLQEIIGVLDTEADGGGTHGARCARGTGASAAGGVRAAAAADPADPAYPAYPAAPLNGGVAELVRRAAGAGMAVEWDGREPTGPAPVARLAEAVAREALTNAAKHAPGARVAVSVVAEGRGRGRRGSRRSRATEVSVVSGPPDGADPTPAVGGGRGLARLADRVRGVGGTLEAGARDDGGFRVAARLPHEAALRAAADGREPAAARGPRRRSPELVSVLLVCVGLLMPLIVAWYAYAAYLDRAAAVSAAEYSAIAVGQPRAAAKDLLPEASLHGTVLVPQTLLDPVGGDPTLDCTYYRSRSGPPWSPAFIYRVCYEDGRVVAKCSYQQARSLTDDALTCEGAAASRQRPSGGPAEETT
ncbi:sensor histidine kinase [Streptomonospora alba]|uniref:sensor histidine kinase n=1 Tax=Streptomonospora alba TaxID=183763 RepID=UPI000699F2B2|nr:histidine kinase [Streptomonospora alba]